MDDYDLLIGVKLYLLDKPTITNAPTEKSLKDAILAVKSAVESGGLSITFVSGSFTVPDPFSFIVVMIISQV